MNLKYPLILGSKSPRRSEILERAGFSFTQKIQEVEERIPSGMAAVEAALYLATLKAAAFSSEDKKSNLILTADTTVVIKDQVLNKPSDEAEASQMLQMLSGEMHEVYTGVSLLSPEKERISFQDQCKVWVDPLSDEEIQYYLRTCKPYDKAGAYGVQEWLGMNKISKIEGSFYTVMGLPIHLVYRALADFVKF